MPRDHVIDPAVVHHQWDADLEPILAIDSGDRVSYDLMVAGERQVWPGATYADVRFDFDTIYNLSGPVLVNGAEPGDTLQVDVLELQHGDWGWSAFLPELGLLPADFPYGYLRTFTLKDGRTEFAPDGEVCGTALEAPLSGSLRFTLHKQPISAPRFRVPAGEASR
jgi:acetamidase/formamidase